MGKIYLYTNLYPYGNVAEAFIQNELKYVGGCELVIIPVNKDNFMRPVPTNVKVDKSICDRGLLRQAKAVCSILCPRLLREVYKTKSTITKHSYIKDLIKYLYAANLVYYDIKDRISSGDNDIFYSYWLSYAPIAFALYKSAYPETSCKFISRAHRVDLYSTDVGVYYPLRDFSFQNIDKVYVISSDGLKYLGEKYRDLNGKMILSRLGVEDNMRHQPQGEYDNSTINIVSCSSVTPVKRVDLIYKSIHAFAEKHHYINIKWCHYGDGYMMPDLKKKIDEMEKLDNFIIEMKGNMSNKDILKDYQDNNYSCFINLSESEGVPVSMMEAISSCIPLLGTDVGGTREVITNETGKLLDANFTQSEFDEALIFVIKNQESLSISAYNFYKNNYNSSKNYTDFYNSLKGL